MSATLADAISKQVKIHWHVRRQTYSIAIRVGKSWKVVGYAPACIIDDAEFITDTRLRAIFEQNPGRRTVHALVKGRLVSYDAAPAGGESVFCNPFRWATFCARGNAIARQAQRVILHSDKTIEAVGLRCDGVAKEVRLQRAAGPNDFALSGTQKQQSF